MSKLDDLLTKLEETSIKKFRESAIYNKLKMQAEGYDKEFVDVWLESMSSLLNPKTKNQVSGIWLLV